MNPIRILFCSLFVVSAAWATPQLPMDAVISPFPPVINEPVTFMGTATSSDHSALTYTWYFYDGTPGATGTTVSHTFTTAATYYVHMHVTDATGHLEEYIAVPVLASPSFSLCEYAKGKGAMSTVPKSSDSITLNGQIPVTPQLVFVKDAPLTFDFAGSHEAFTMSSIKSGKNADGSKISLKLPKQAGGLGKFTVILKKQNFYPGFVKAGFVINPGIAVSQMGLETTLLYNGTQIAGAVYINVNVPVKKARASIIPTPGLTVSGNIGTAAVRCASDARFVGSGSGEDLNQ